MSEKDAEMQKKDQYEIIEEIPIESPSENSLVTEHLQRMPNIFSRGLIYIIALILCVGFMYLILGRTDIVAECRAVARPLSHKLRVLSDRNGYLEQIFVSEGQEVEENAPLFLIRSKEPLQHSAEVKRLKLEQNQSTLMSIESEIKYWQKESNRFYKEYKGLERLYKGGIISLREYNDAKSKYEKARTEVRKLTSKKEITLNENKILKEEMEKDEEEMEKTIKAENAGIISELYFRNTGAYIRESDLLCTIVPVDSPLYMDINIANKDIGFIEEDMEIKYKFDAFPYTDYGLILGKITAISPSAIEEEKLGFFYHAQGTLDKAYFDIRGKNYSIKAGMTAIAEVVTEKKSLFSLLFRKFRGAK